MSLEEQFDREMAGSGAKAFDDLLPEERDAVVKALGTLIDLAESGHAEATRVMLGFLHTIYKNELMETHIGMDPIKAHVLDETWRARCAALLEAMDLLTDAEAMAAVHEKLIQEN
jgi:hypothetical protein